MNRCVGFTRDKKSRKLQGWGLLGKQRPGKIVQGRDTSLGCQQEGSEPSPAGRSWGNSALTRLFYCS